MTSILQLAAAVVGLAGGLFGFKWVTTPRRFHARRSFRATATFVLLGISFYLLYLANHHAGK